MKYFVVTLHGPPGAGKTSVKQILLGKGPLPQKRRNSTNIMNTVRSVHTNRITSKERTNFKEVSNKQVLEMIAKKVKKQSKAIGNAARVGSKLNDDSSGNENTISLSSKENQENIPPIDPDAEILNNIRTELPKVDPSNELFDYVWMYLIDSGGQPQFSNILPLLFHHQSLHIVVFRLTDDLNSKPPVRYYQSGRDYYQFDEKLSLTNLEYIEQMCEIAEAAERYTNFKSSVIVIGTHLDKLPQGKERNQRLQKMNRELWQKLQKYKRYLVLQCCVEDKEEIIFSMNAVIREKNQRKEYSSELQKQIRASHIQDSSNREKDEMLHVKWLALQLDLVKYGSVLSIHKCYERGAHLGMPKEEVQLALLFFKEVGLNLYYPDSDCDLVFTKLDPLIGRLSALIKASFNPPAGITGKSTELRKRGLFDQEMLTMVMNLEDIKCNEISNDNFIRLLTHLKVIRPTKIGTEEKYFLPSALALTDSNDPFKFSCDKEPLVATFNESILPSGFFMMLIIQLLEDKSGVLDYNPGDGIAQYRNAILLVVNEKINSIEGGGLTVVDKRRWIEFNFNGPSSSCFNLFEIIKRALGNTIIAMTLKPGDLSFGFLCQICNSNDHICKLNESLSIVSCLGYRFKPKVLVTGESRLCWLRKINEGNLHH